MGNAASEYAQVLQSLSTEKLCFELFFLRNVGVDDKDRFGLPSFVVHQSPAAFDKNFLAVFGDLREFPLPLTCLGNSFLDVFNSRQGVVIQKLIGTHYQGFVCLPAIQALGTFVPE